MGIFIISNEPWHNQARCQQMGAMGDVFFPASEINSRVNDVRRYCDLCPVRGHCLKGATDSGSEGLWAATTTKQRKALRKVTHRAKCPLCLGKTLAQVEPFEICMGCGSSWRTENRPQVVGELVAS